MCIDCVRKYVGTSDVDTTTDAFKEVAALVEWVYAQEGYSVGGPLHVQLDDFNLEDRNLTENSLVWWTRGYPAKEGIRAFPAPAPDGFPEGHEEKFLRLLELLRGMSLAERAAAVWVGHGRSLEGVG